MHRFRSLLHSLPIVLAVGIVVAIATHWHSPRQTVAARRPGEAAFGPVIDAPQSGRMYAEFERQDAVMIGFNELVQYHPQTLVDIVRAINGRLQIVGLISSPEQEQKVLELLEKNNVANSNVEFFFWPAVSMWVQDFGPKLLVGDEVRVIDYCYGFPDREAEDTLSLAFAAKQGYKIANSRLTMEGGNLLTNGHGYCITTSVIVDQNASRGYDMQKVGAILKTDFRMNQWSYLQALDGEATGHVDMFLTMIDPTTVVLGEYNMDDDAVNALRLEKNHDVLAAIRIDEQPLKILRVPMPARTDGLWRTYTNVIYANGVLLVPQYPTFCPDLDKQALEIYRKAMPEWEVVGIDASTLIKQRGSLHCIMTNVPKLNEME